MKKITVNLTNEEWQALTKDSEINVRDAENHIRYLIKFHLLGYKDIKIDQIMQSLTRLHNKLEAIRFAISSASSPLSDTKNELMVIETNIVGLIKSFEEERRNSQTSAMDR